MTNLAKLGLSNGYGSPPAKDQDDIGQAEDPTNRQGAKGQSSGQLAPMGMGQGQMAPLGPRERFNQLINEEGVNLHQLMLDLMTKMLADAEKKAATA